MFSSISALLGQGFVVHTAGLYSAEVTLEMTSTVFTLALRAWRLTTTGVPSPEMKQKVPMKMGL